jgi:hypothetical protein
MLDASISEVEARRIVHEVLEGDCPRRDARSLHERCDLIWPDLPKVLLKDSSA